MSGEKKILILDSTGVDWTDQHLKDENTDVTSVYRQVPFLFRVVRRLFFYCDLPLKNIWYNSWKNHLNQYKVIIVFSAILGNEIFSWIRENGYKGRLIFYYRDFVNAKHIRAFAKPKNIIEIEPSVELWSFDPEDSKKYGMKYNPQFYFKLSDDWREIKYDIVFVGATNGRLEKIIKWKRIFENLHLSVYFHIKCHRFEQIPQEYQNDVTNEALPYESILDLDREARAIFEVNQAGQTGLTVRALEATFLKKKLITTNTDIKYTKLYNPNNIYIIGTNRQQTIQNFLSSEYDVTNYDNIIHYYESKSWLARFLDNPNG